MKKSITEINIFVKLTNQPSSNGDFEDLSDSDIVESVPNVNQEGVEQKGPACVKKVDCVSKTTRMRRGRNSRILSEQATEVLSKWFEAHHEHPYPTNRDKVNLAMVTGLEFKQVNNCIVKYKNYLLQQNVPHIVTRISMSSKYLLLALLVVCANAAGLKLAEAVQITNSTKAQVYEIGISYELCEWDKAVPPSEVRPNWSNMTLSLGQLSPGKTIYGAIQVWDVPSETNVPLEHIRINFNDLSGDSVTVRLRQVHTSAAVQTKSQFFSLNKAQRQQFYQDYLPGTEQHDADITYPEEKVVGNCANSYDCGYILEKPKLSDLADIMPVFIFSVTNTQTSPLPGGIKVSAFAGDKSPDCRIPPVGIVIGSLWTAAVFIIIIVVVALLSWEKIMLRRQLAYQK
ncbi:2 TM domain-containing transmembrane protein [Acrasis kona]|uniref:2 TM domain-containing transmembrane protein n=1 Tax=Acrasis kona TaxID=1008807 RepID=A0AAW2ZNW2_9EUKA